MIASDGDSVSQVSSLSCRGVPLPTEGPPSGSVFSSLTAITLHWAQARELLWRDPCSRAQRPACGPGSSPSELTKSR